MPTTVLDISVWGVCVYVFCHVLTAESGTILDQKTSLEKHTALEAQVYKTKREKIRCGPASLL